MFLVHLATPYGNTSEDLWYRPTSSHTPSRTQTADPCSTVCVRPRAHPSMG